MIRKSKFYSYFNLKLKQEFPVIKDKIRYYLKNKSEFSQLKVICQLEIHPWKQVTQWRIEIDFDDFEWDLETFKPHFLGAFASLEEVEGKRILHCNFGKTYNSFNRDEEINNACIKINYSNIDSTASIEFMKKEIEKFIENLYSKFIKEIDQIDLDRLSYLIE